MVNGGKKSSIRAGPPPRRHLCSPTPTSSRPASNTTPRATSTKSAINVREYWPFPLHADTPEEQAARIHARNQFDITAQLYTTPGLTMDLDLHYNPDSTTPATIEAFYAHAHLALGCGTDPHN